jgi:hypothetical protein
MINVDWWKPYKHSIKTVGTIYLVICNLPREMRFQKECKIVLGIIPGPREPSHQQINNYLEPVVNELLQLWRGVIFQTHQYPNGGMVYGGLILCACDIPAARKLCGFQGHMSSCGCSKCLRIFSYDSNSRKVDYSGVMSTTGRKGASNNIETMLIGGKRHQHRWKEIR